MNPSGGPEGDGSKRDSNQQPDSGCQERVEMTAKMLGPEAAHYMSQARMACQEFALEWQE